MPPSRDERSLRDADRNVLRLEQNDEERERLGEDRDAFEQEQRQVDRAGDLSAPRSAGAPIASAAPAASLPMPRPAPMTTQPEAEPGAHERNRITFHSSNPPSEWLLVMRVDRHAHEHGGQ